MMMLATLLAAATVAAPASAPAAVTNEWEDLAVNELNRLPARTYSMPLKDVESALTDAIEPSTPWKMSLNGTWKLSWAGSPELRVRDFWKTDFDDSAWFPIDVPSCVEMRGFGTPGYVNVRYPHANRWPQILDRQSGKADYNPVSSYRTRFTVPATWAGRDVILRFDGVYSAYYVWVNGRRVGYAEDSKLPSEFDVTDFLKAGENVLAVEVYRWCDGSYLEDQDMFRFSGIFRDVTLWSKPKYGIWDFSVVTELAKDRRSARLRVDGLKDGAELSLYDASFRKLCDFKATDTMAVPDVRLWSAEDPYLYTLVIRYGNDIRMKRIGFKEQKIVGNVFTVNGKPVKFKGVNRHETNPDNGRTVSLDDMLADITLFKRYNINTVRTCHYPDHHLWYDLCDRYGIYVVAEANVEGHEPGYGEQGLGRQPAFYHTIVERNRRHVTFYRNNPSVTLWSMGNETGHGDGFRLAIESVRKLDPSRPIHWERGNRDADVDSRMYPTVDWLEKRGQLGDGKLDELGPRYPGDFADHTKGKCFFMCEYAHAMGNAIGNFREYWDVFYAHPSLSGGCIWDWVDQAVWKYTDRTDPATGRRERYLAYGGDFDEEPNDGPFCCNGIVDPFRRVSAKLLEVAHVHRNLVTTRLRDDVFTLSNRFAFTSADAFAGSWEIMSDGAKVASGAFAVPALEPLSRCNMQVEGVAEALAKLDPSKESFIVFTYATTRDEIWAKRGWVVARDQLKLGGDAFAAFPGKVAAAAMTVVPGERTLTVTAGTTRAVFCRRSGTLCELVMDGKRILRDPAPGVVAGPRFTCARAFADNDISIRKPFYESGLTQLSYHARPLVVTEDAVRCTVEVTGRKSGGFTHVATWRFRADGSIAVENEVTPHGTLPQLPRLGLSLQLDPSLEGVSYYGRGPQENYVDRCAGAFLGVWKSTVRDLFEPYVRPQDNACRGDVRWVRFTDWEGKGVRFSASRPLFVQALHYGWEDLEFARHRNGQQRIYAPLRPRKEVMLNLDVAQRGLGGNSCGPNPMEKYLVKAERTAWTVLIESAK